MTKTKDVLLTKAGYIAGTILDLGAGNTKYKTLLESLATHYTAFDVESAPTIDIVGDIHDLPFEENSFDTVICTQVFEHIKEPWVVAGQIQKVLRPGGYAVITAPFMIPYHAHPHDFYRFTPEGLAQLFHGKLHVVECRKYGSTFVVFSELVRFTFLSPYKKHSRIKLIVLKRLINLLVKLDRFSCANNAFANSYIVVKK
jgi:2-polyprenyl-3-methyl-5-hydroxy-6-metoxy-1,4-benzoquinol methylase